MTRYDPDVRTLQENVGIGHVERELLTVLVGRADRHPVTVAVWQAGRTNCRVDGRLLVGETGAQDPTFVELVVCAERVEITIFVIQRDMRDGEPQLTPTIAGSPTRLQFCHSKPACSVKAGVMTCERPTAT